MTAVLPDLVHTYQPRGTARRVLEDRSPELLVVGPAGTGKSRAALEKIHLAALLTPGMRGLIVRKTAVSLGSTTLVTFREHVAQEALQSGTVTYYSGSPEKAAGYLYDNGSTIVVGGLDKPEKVLSSEYDLIIVDEAIELTSTDWETLTTRLRNGRLSFQQILGCTNPSVPTHWLKKRADSGSVKLLTSLHVDNPVLYNDDGTLTERGTDYMAKLDALTGVRKDRLRWGRWVAAEGVIYEEYNPAIHEVPAFVIPDSWPRYWVIDFGYTNPFVWQCWAEDPDGRLFLYREMYQTRRTVEHHALVMLEHVTGLDGEWVEPRPVALITDHDAEGRATLEEKTGLETTAADKRVSIGLQAVRDRLKKAGDGKARMYLVEGSLLWRDKALEEANKPCSSQEEFPGYVWDKGVRKEASEKEVPLKVNDHGMDCVRYLCAHIDLGETKEIVEVGGFW